jgi:hypothetical protein
MATPFPFTAGQVLTAAQLNAISELVTNTQTGDYTLAATDAGDRVIANKATAITFTVPNSVFSASQVVHIHNIGAGTLTIAAGAGATVNGADVLTVNQYQGGTLYFTSASSSIWFPTAKTVTSAVVQVKSTAKTDTFTSTSTTYTDITGLSVSITPTSASNKVLVLAQLTLGIGAGASTDVGQFRFTGGNSTNYVGDAASTRTRGTFGGFGHAAMNSLNLGLSMVYLDSPATTSATTYKVQGKVSTTYTGTFYVNRSGSDNDNDGHTRGASSITAIEVTP